MSFCVMTATRIPCHGFTPTLFNVPIGLVEFVLCLVFIDVGSGDHSFRKGCRSSRSGGRMSNHD